MENHIPSNFTIIGDRLVDIDTGEIVQEGEKEIVGFLHCMDYFGYAYSCKQSA